MRIAAVLGVVLLAGAAAGTLGWMGQRGNAAGEAVEGPAVVRVGAAISLREALEEIGKQYEARTGQHVEFTFASSGRVMRQIESGARIDVFIAAAKLQVDELTREKLADAASVRVIVRNELVLIAPTISPTIAPGKAIRDGQGGVDDSLTSFSDLAAAGVERVAIGEPKTVPAGEYARQVFARLNLTDALAGKLVYGANVRQVLGYVEQGEVDAGIVYATDAKQAGEKVRVVATSDAQTHEPIVYPAVIVSASRKKEQAGRFLNYLQTPGARAIFVNKGFVVDDRQVVPSGPASSQTATPAKTTQSTAFPGGR